MVNVLDRGRGIPGYFARELLEDSVVKVHDLVADPAASTEPIGIHCHVHGSQSG